MKKREFIDVAKRMVKEYFKLCWNKKIVLTDISTIGYRDNSNYLWVLLSVDDPTSDRYEVVYHKNTGQISSNMYKDICKR